MTIINRSMFPLSSGINNIMGMKERYDSLQTQLASGQKAATLGQMGTDRYFDLALRQRMARIDGFQDSIKSVNLRLNVLDNTIGRLDTIEADARAATQSGSGGQNSLNFDTAPALAMASFDEVMTLLNVDVAGRYLFGGNKTEARPAENSLSVLNGVGARAGFHQVVDERQRADLGTARLGRLEIATATDTVTLSEEGLADMPFGMKLSTVVGSGNITVTTPPAWNPGDPVPAAERALDVQFGTPLPLAGETVTITFKMPDGTQESLILTATTEAGQENGFVIGADADATAANFATTLEASITKLAEGKMVTASAYEASENFFFGHNEQPMRVGGTPPETATTLVAGNTANTIFWYKGGDDDDARGSITAKVGEGATVAYGVQGTEQGLVNLVRALATMGIQNFPASDPTSTERYNAMTARNNERLAENGASNTGSIEMIAVELGLAKSTTGAVEDRHTAHKAQLGNMLQDIEEAPTEVVAMEILALKTRLEASYQTTAMLSQLSLVNYLR